MTDKSGEPRSLDDLRDAIKAVESTMVRDMLKLPPELAVMMGTIREALTELMGRRISGELDEVSARFKEGV